MTDDAAAFPPIDRVLPHAGPAILLSRVVAHDDAHTVCLAAPALAGLYRDDEGRIPSWVGVEMMAQCVAAHAGLRSHARGERPRIGFLLGTRRLALGAAALPPDRELEVRAEHLWGDGRMVSFTCEVRETDGGPPLLAGNLNAYVPDDAELGRLGLAP